MEIKERSLAFGTTDAIATFYELATGAGVDPWWATGDALLWTPVCLGDDGPLKGAERAVAVAASLAFGLASRLGGHWWQEIGGEALPQAVMLPDGRRLVPLVGNAAAEGDGTLDLLPKDPTVIISRLTATPCVGLSWSDVALPMLDPKDARTVLVPTARTWGAGLQDLIGLVWTMSAALAAMDSDDAGFGTMRHEVTCELCCPFTLAALGISPKDARGARLSPRFDAVRKLRKDTRQDLTAELLIGASTRAESLSSTMLGSVRDLVVDALRCSPTPPSTHGQTTRPTTLGPTREALSQGPYTLARALSDTLHVSRMLSV